MMAMAGYGQKNDTTMETKAKTLTCKLTTAELRERKSNVIADLKLLVQERKELESGYSYLFESTDRILDQLNEFIKTERMCCDFFVFQLTIDGNAAILDITGPAGAKEFLREEVDL